MWSEGLHNCPLDLLNKQVIMFVGLCPSRRKPLVASSGKAVANSWPYMQHTEQRVWFFNRKKTTSSTSIKTHTHHLKVSLSRSSSFLSCTSALFSPASHVVKYKLYGATLLPPDWLGHSSDPRMWFVVAKQWGAVESENKTAWSC